MKEYAVKLLCGFNGVEFGMDRSQVRAILGDPTKEFKKSKFSKMTTDDYIEYHVFYDKNNKFEAVEFFDNVKIKVDDRMLFTLSIEELKDTKYDFNIDGDGLISQRYSIGIYAPNGKIESVLFGVKDYYSDTV